MKSILLLSLLITLCMAKEISAQDLSRSGQTYLKFFNGNLTKLQGMNVDNPSFLDEIDKAKKNLKSLKGTDPAYDISSLEAQLSEFSTSLADAGNAKSAKKKSNANIEEEIEQYLFKKTDDFGNAKTEEDITKIAAEVDAFEKEINAFAKNAGDQTDNDSALDKAEDAWTTNSKDDSFIFYAKKNAGTETNPILAKVQYYSMKLINIKWAAIATIFPESETLQEATTEAADAFKMMRSPESMAKNAVEKSAANLASVKMEPAVVSDAAFEVEITKALAQSQVAAGKEVIKVHILNKDWNIKRHEVTGVILSKSRNFCAVWKEKDGTCTLLQYTSYKQDYDGRGYGKGFVYMGQTTKILCENVK